MVTPLFVVCWYGRRENLAHTFRAIDVVRKEAIEHRYAQLFLIRHDVAFTEITDYTAPMKSQSIQSLISTSERKSSNRKKCLSQ